MRKTTKRSLTKKLDKEVSRIVRLRGVCARCGKGAEKVTLHCAHIFSRRNMSVRFDLDNCLPLCYACHFWWAHPNPILFTEFVKTYLGKFKYLALKRKATQIRKWNLEEMQELLEDLKEVNNA